MSTQLIYISSRLNGRTPIKRQYQIRYEAEFCAELVQRGVSVYSPLCHRGMLASRAVGLEESRHLFAGADRQIMAASACVLLCGKPDEADALMAKDMKKDIVIVNEWRSMDALATMLRDCYPIQEEADDGE